MKVEGEVKPEQRFLTRLEKAGLRAAERAKSYGKIAEKEKSNDSKMVSEKDIY